METTKEKKKRKKESRLHREIDRAALKNAEISAHAAASLDACANHLTFTLDKKSHL